MAGLTAISASTSIGGCSRRGRIGWQSHQAGLRPQLARRAPGVAVLYGKLKAVVTGFVSDDEKELYGAPVGLAVDKTGALLIADDVGNTVWRVSANNAHGQVLGNLPVTLSLNKLRQPDRSSPQAGSSTTWSTTRKPFTCNKRLYSSGARLA